MAGQARASTRCVRASTGITADFPYRSVVETDLLERPLPQPDALSADGSRLALRPFRIVTLRFARGTGG